MKLFFATDIHGSEVCYRKLLNVVGFYGVDVVVLGGDITGKAVVTIVSTSNGTYQADYLGASITLESAESLQDFVKHLRNVGLYAYVTNREEVAALAKDKSRANVVFKELIAVRLQEWLDFLDRKFIGTSFRLLVCPGNDDDFFVDDILAKSSRVVNIGGTVMEFDHDAEILSLGYSNPTPWHTPRECSESQLKSRIEDLVGRTRQLSKTIFNLHVPPFNTLLDRAPRLDERLRVITHLGHTETIPVGSTAVRESVERYQPLLGLFGHVHEGRGFTRLGRTLCVNPGSNYSEGILNGCLVTLDRGSIKDFQLTTG